MSRANDAAETYMVVVQAAFEDLFKAAQELFDVTEGAYVKPPRPRLIKIAPGLSWPYHNDVFGNDHYEFRQVFDDPVKPRHRQVFSLKEDQHRRDLTFLVLHRYQLRPRGIHGALRRLQAAREWCQHRASGAERHMDEIFRQQARWDRLLVREHHLLELGGRLPS
jgi:hypothetical protein